MTFDVEVALHFLVRLAIAFGLALPVAWEREVSTRTMGLRTFPIVAMASCGFVLLSTTVVSEFSDDAQTRVIQGLMTGIGFIGGGAILKGGSGVRGTATAASIWTMGAAGASVGFDQVELAVLIALINWAALLVLTPIERRLGKMDRDPKQVEEDS